MMRDGVACYEKVGKRWRRYEYDNKTKQFRYKREQEIDVGKCHPINGKVEEGRLYMHMKFNIMNEPKEGSQGKAKEQMIEEIEPEQIETKIYSDGSAHVEEQRGACAAIVNTEGKHVVAMRTLHSEREKNSYRTELEGIYLGTTLAMEAGSTDKQW